MKRFIKESVMSSNNKPKHAVWVKDGQDMKWKIFKGTDNDTVDSNFLSRVNDQNHANYIDVIVVPNGKHPDEVINSSSQSEYEYRRKVYLRRKHEFETLGEEGNNDVLSREEKMNIAKAEMDKTAPKSVKSAKDATFKTDKRLSPTSERYKGYLIVLDRGGDGYNVYDKHRELEDAGYPSREAAKQFIDELENPKTIISSANDDDLIINKTYTTLSECFYDTLSNLYDAEWDEVIDVFESNNWISEDELIIPEGTKMTLSEVNNYYNVFEVDTPHGRAYIPLRIEDCDGLFREAPDQEIYSSKSLNTNNSERKFQRVNGSAKDSEYALLKKAYSHLREFEDQDKQSGNIRDLTDELNNKCISYEIYHNKTNNGCTIFYNDDGTISSASKIRGKKQRTIKGNASNITQRTRYIPSSRPDYCPHCCNRSLIHSNNGEAKCQSCGQEYQVEKMSDTGSIKLVYLDNTSVSSSAITSSSTEYPTDCRYFAYVDDDTPVGPSFLDDEDAIEYAIGNVYPIVKVHNYYIDNGKHYPDGDPKVIWKDGKSINSAYYGGAFDIEDDQFFTKDEIVEFGNSVCDRLNETSDDIYNVAEVYMKTPKKLVLTVVQKSDESEFTATIDIDMRKIKKPSDLTNRYLGDVVYALQQDIKSYNDEINASSDIITNATDYEVRPYGYSDAIKFINGKAPNWWWELPEVEMDFGDGRKLSEYCKKRRILVEYAEDDEMWFIRGKFHWSDAYFYSYKYSFESDYPETVLESTEITSGIYDVPDRPLDPPEDDSWEDLDSYDEVIEITLDADIQIDEDGRWEYDDTNYSWAASPDHAEGDWYSAEHNIRIGDTTEIVECVDELLLPMMPDKAGKYHIKGDVSLVFSIEGIKAKRNHFWDERHGAEYDEELYTDDATTSFLYDKSSIKQFEISEK